MLEWLTPGTASGLTVAALTALCVAGVAVAFRAPGRWAISLLTAVALGGITFQVVHFVEHGGQLGYWILHPDQKPWLTPWAGTAVEGLNWMCGSLATSRPTIGTEQLHLLGNSIFLAAIVALALLVQARAHKLREVRCLRGALIVQGFHVFEHVLLTIAVVAGNEALGFSTAFGLVAGNELTALRVGFHFLINLVATALAIAMLVSAANQGLLSVAGSIGVPRRHPVVPRRPGA